MVTRPLSGEGEGGMHRIQSEKRKKKNKNKEINKSLLYLSLSDLSHKPLSAAERVSKLEQTALILLANFYAMVAYESQLRSHSASNNSQQNNRPKSKPRTR